MGDFHTKLKAIYEVAHLTNGDLRPRKPGFMHEELQSLKSSVPKPTFFFPLYPTSGLYKHHESVVASVSPVGVKVPRCC